MIYYFFLFLFSVFFICSYKRCNWLARVSCFSVILSLIALSIILLVVPSLLCVRFLCRPCLAVCTQRARVSTTKNLHGHYVLKICGCRWAERPTNANNILRGILRSAVRDTIQLKNDLHQCWLWEEIHTTYGINLAYIKYTRYVLFVFLSVTTANDGHKLLGEGRLLITTAASGKEFQPVINACNVTGAFSALSAYGAVCIYLPFFVR